MPKTSEIIAAALKEAVLRTPSAFPAVSARASRRGSARRIEFVLTKQELGALAAGRPRCLPGALRADHLRSSKRGSIRPNTDARCSDTATRAACPQRVIRPEEKALTKQYF